MKKQRCYIYTRVSTAMQVDGFSLDAQKEKLKKYADYQDMVVVREFSDEGKSGKNVDGRPQFKEMLELIEAGTDDIDYVLVFKLSRFGRNAADVLSSLQKMQDFGVNLICVEDGIDSSKDAGKLMISVLSAVAEIERDNILVQTMEGRKQKASRKVKVDFSLEDMDLSEFKGKATYEQIKAYVLEKTGLKVSSLYIAQIKKKCGLDVGENFNPAKSENARQPQCTPEKEDAIMQAFRHFGII